MFSRTGCAIILLCLSQLAFSVILKDRSGVVNTIQDPNYFGKSSVRRTFTDENVQKQRLNGNGFLIGIKQPGSVLVRRANVQSFDEATTFEAFSGLPITYIEALDQSNGTGGYVHYYRGGIQKRFLNMDFRRIAEAKSPIDFIVEVWALPASNNMVAVGDFRVGELTDRSLFAISVMFNYPSSNYESIQLTWTMVGSADDNYTFIEGFDMTDNGSGGVVSVTDGGVGHNFFELTARSVGVGVPLNVTFVAYYEDPINGGQNFRFGHYRPGIQLLGYDYLEEDSIEGEILTGKFDFAQTNSEIEFIQGWDLVTQGTGELAAIAGGVGCSNVSLILHSGVGEDLRNFVSVYGFSVDD